jgi:hypothetical protein
MHHVPRTRLCAWLCAMAASHSQGLGDARRRPGRRDGRAAQGAGAARAPRDGGRAAVQQLRRGLGDRRAREHVHHVVRRGGARRAQRNLLPCQRQPRMCCGSQTCTSFTTSKRMQLHRDIPGANTAFYVQLLFTVRGA